jgi:hypothetical protein
MKTNGGNSQRRVNPKLLAVGWIVLLEVVAAIYLYTGSAGGQGETLFTFPTTSTPGSSSSGSSSSSTTHPPTDVVKVESAAIVDDTLMMKVHNLGPSTTNLLTVISICTPAPQVCYNYRTMAGSYFQETFVLPPKRIFMANLTGVCTIAISSCKTYFPVANETYYLEVKFSLIDGTTVTVPVSATANNTWSKYPSAVTGIGSSSLKVVPANLTGMLNVTVNVNSSLPYASFTTKLDGYLKPSSAFSGTILTNDTGCGGAFSSDCSAPVTVISRFYTVLTGIIPGPWYAVVVRDTTDIDNKTGGFPDADVHPSSFAIWVRGTS